MLSNIVHVDDLPRSDDGRPARAQPPSHSRSADDLVRLGPLLALSALILAACGQAGGDDGMHFRSGDIHADHFNGERLCAGTVDLQGEVVTREAPVRGFRGPDDVVLSSHSGWVLVDLDLLYTSGADNPGYITVRPVTQSGVGAERSLSRVRDGQLYGSGATLVPEGIPHSLWRSEAVFRPGSTADAQFATGPMTFKFYVEYDSPHTSHNESFEFEEVVSDDRGDHVERDSGLGVLRLRYTRFELPCGDGELNVVARYRRMLRVHSSSEESESCATDILHHHDEWENLLEMEFPLVDQRTQSTCDTNYCEYIRSRELVEQQEDLQTELEKIERMANDAIHRWDTADMDVADELRVRAIEQAESVVRTAQQISETLAGAQQDTIALMGERGQYVVEECHERGVASSYDCSGISSRPRNLRDEQPEEVRETPGAVSCELQVVAALVILDEFSNTIACAGGIIELMVTGHTAIPPADINACFQAVEIALAAMAGTAIVCHGLSIDQASGRDTLPPDPVSDVPVPEYEGESALFCASDESPLCMMWD